MQYMIVYILRLLQDNVLLVKQVAHAVKLVAHAALELHLARPCLLLQLLLAVSQTT